MTKTNKKYILHNIVNKIKNIYQNTNRRNRDQKIKINASKITNGTNTKKSMYISENVLNQIVCYLY